MISAVFRDYDQKALDLEYDNRGRFPDTADCKAAQVEGSDEAKNTFNCRLDIRFGPDKTDLLDIYLAEGDTPNPIHVFFHGGYWKSNTKNDFGFVAKPFVPHGITTVVVEYPLIPAVRMNKLIDRCRAAMNWVWQNADSFGGNRDKITISGHSAGGHITAMMLQTDWPTYSNELPKNLIKAGCSISGVSDLEPVRLSFQNDELQFDKNEAAAFSTLYMQPRHPGPLLGVAGGIEGPEFIRQTTELMDAWGQKGMDTKCWIMEGKHHFTTINQYLAAESDLSRKVRDLTNI